MIALMWVRADGVTKADEGRADAPDGPGAAADGATGHPTANGERLSTSDARASHSTDPSVDELCRAAVVQALAEPERARSFLLRARLAGWLPELRFRFFRRFARTEGLTLDDTVASTPLDVSAVDDVRYEWRATWDLSRMVFNSDELHAHSEALRMADVRRDIQALVVRLYFERRRLLVGPPKNDGSVDAEEHRRLRVAEVEAQLEALTGRELFPSAGALRSAGGGPGEAHP
ncbi:MAG TPA: hypothetical protein VIU64_15415 [Polyangia bacterium]